MALINGNRLSGVDPDLAGVVRAVAQDHDIIVIQGARSIAQERAAILSGASHLKNPMNSYHVIDMRTRTLALAVDIALYTGNPDHPVDWNNHANFVMLGDLMKAKAAELGVTPFSWGGDWPNPFDWDHFQKAPGPA